MRNQCFGTMFPALSQVRPGRSAVELKHDWLQRWLGACVLRWMGLKRKLIDPRLPTALSHPPPQLRQQAYQCPPRQDGFTQPHRSITSRRCRRGAMLLDAFHRVAHGTLLLQALDAQHSTNTYKGTP